MAASDYTPTTLNYRLHLTGCPQMDSGQSLFVIPDLIRDDEEEKAPQLGRQRPLRSIDGS